MRYRKKPVIIEANQFTNENKDCVFNWVSEHQMNVYPSFDDKNNPILCIPTLEGEMIASLGDYVIQGINGEFYPCKPDIFEKTYEFVEGVELFIDNESCFFPNLGIDLSQGDDFTLKRWYL